MFLSSYLAFKKKLIILINRYSYFSKNIRTLISNLFDLGGPKNFNMKAFMDYFF
jgi:hypothetical protein